MALVTIRIVDPQGRPQAGVRLHFTSDSINTLEDEITDHNGLTTGHYHDKWLGHHVDVWLRGKWIGDFKVRNGLTLTF